MYTAYVQQNNVTLFILEKLKYPQMDLYKITQREHVSNILVAKYAGKSHDVSLWLVIYGNKGHSFHDAVFNFSPLITSWR